MHAPPDCNDNDDEYDIKPFDQNGMTVGALEHRQDFLAQGTTALRKGWVTNHTLDSPDKMVNPLGNGALQVAYGASHGMVSAQPLSGANFPKSQESSQTSSNGSISPRTQQIMPNGHLKA